LFSWLWFCSCSIFFFFADVRIETIPFGVVFGRYGRIFLFPVSLLLRRIKKRVARYSSLKVALGIFRYVLFILFSSLPVRTFFPFHLFHWAFFFFFFKQRKVTLDFLSAPFLLEIMAALKRESPPLPFPSSLVSSSPREGVVLARLF